MRLFKSALVGVGGVAVIAATLSAPPASAETEPQGRAAQPAVTSVVSDTTATPAANNESTCEFKGHEREDDTDCVTVRVVSDTWVKGAGEDIALRGKVHSSIPLAPGTRVVIQRATDGGAWHDKGEKWRKVATAKVRENGSFRKNVVLHRTGVHTFRAKLVTAASPRVAAQPAVALARTVTARDNVTPDLAVSATTAATAGVAYYAYEFHNLSGHDLNISCQGFRQESNGGNIVYSPSTSYIKLVQNGEPVSCAYPIAPDSSGNNTIAAGFTLQQANPIIGSGSIYHFDPKNTGNFKACSDKQPRIAPRDIVRVDITPADWFNLEMGYSGTMNFPSDQAQPMCDFFMTTKLQSALWVGAPGWVRILEVIGVTAIVIFAAFAGSIALFGFVGAGTAMFAVMGGMTLAAFYIMEAVSSGVDSCQSIAPSCTSDTGIKYGVVKIPS
jgi:hypothetical protein